jgi:hypothetical protein
MCVCVCVFCQGQAANTANRRVLVTDKNGKQSVQAINDELGMNGKDMGDVKRRLGKQGVDTSNVEMYGSGEYRMDKPTSFRRGANLPGDALPHRDEGPCLAPCAAFQCSRDRIE